MASSTIEDGTWTQNLRRQRNGVWTAWLTRSGVLDPRFQRARFVLAGGPTVLISADQLRAALAAWLAEPNGDSLRPVKIDIERSTVNGIPVEMDRAA